jgi:DNA invertase Pin-like site-specific DNA recombinase
MKATAYIRVSTAQQAEEGVSLEAQQARIAAYCMANGLELVNTFTDAGLSGKRADNRPGLQAALEAVCNDGGILVVYSLSRLARSVGDTLQIAEQLRKSGAELASLSERIDTSSAGGRMVFTMLAAFAQFERDLTAERTSAALQHKKSLGQRVGTVPFGYRLADDGITLLAIPEQQRALEIIRQLRESGCTLQQIADRLEAAGVLTAKGKTSWSPKVVRGLVTRTA